MTELDLLTAILASPKENGPRLAYADWLLKKGDWRGELIQVQCQLADRIAQGFRRRPRGAPTLKALRARESELLARLEQARPDWVSQWPPHVNRGLVTGISVRDATTFLARRDEIRREYPLATLMLEDGGFIDVSADGRRYAILNTEYESAGSIASSTKTTTDTVTVYDREGRSLHSESHSIGEYESSSGYTWESGETISSFKLSADGRTLTLKLSQSGEVTRTLPE